MKTDVTEIADRIYRLSTLVPQIGPNGFTFNQFLIDADEPLLFHYGHRAMFPLISKAVASVAALSDMTCLICGHSMRPPGYCELACGKRRKSAGLKA